MLRHGIILVLFAISLSSCTKSTKVVSSETLRIGLASPIASFDPIHATDDSSTQLLNLFYQPLFIVTQDGNNWPRTEANILKELPAISEDGRELRLQLKTGLRFESREANSKDLALTILRNSDRSLNATYAEAVENIEGVKEWWKGTKDPEKLPVGLKIVDATTLIIRFKSPAPNWWYNLSAINFALVPAEAFGKSLSLPMGTGDYQIKENTKERLIVSRKNGSGPKQIEYRIYENRVDESSELFLKNELDILPISPAQSTIWFAGSSLKKELHDAGKKAFFGPTGQYVALLLNPGLKIETKKQLHVRLNQHLDRAMAALSLGPLLSPCNSLYRCDMNLPAAKKYDGKDILKVRILLSATHGDASTRDALKILLQNAGIDVSFVDGNVSAKGDWKADLALIDVNMVTYDPTDLLSLGNASPDIRTKMFNDLSRTQPSAAALESLSIWTRDEADLIVVARRRSAAITNSSVSKVQFNIQGWLDPR